MVTGGTPASTEERSPTVLMRVDWLEPLSETVDTKGTAPNA
jgi:hypothetical protein